MWVETTHPGVSSLLMSLFAYLLLVDLSGADSRVSEVVLYFYLNVQVWMFPTTEVIFLQVHFTNDKLLGYRLYSPTLCHYTRGIKLFYDKMPYDGVT